MDSLGRYMVQQCIAIQTRSKHVHTGHAILNRELAQLSTNPWTSSYNKQSLNKSRQNSFPVVLFPNWDDSWRFCINYRWLKAIKIWEAYPIPSMNECVDSIDEVTRISTVGAILGYWQGPIAEEHQAETMFMFQYGTYYFWHMPFGPTVAPATIQSKIDILPNGLK